MLHTNSRQNAYIQNSHTGYTHTSQAQTTQRCSHTEQNATLEQGKDNVTQTVQWGHLLLLFRHGTTPIGNVPLISVQILLVRSLILCEVHLAAVQYLHAFPENRDQLLISIL